MEEKYLNLVRSFKKLSIEEKRDEVLRHTYELLNFLYFINKKIDNYNKPLGVLKNYNDDDSYLDLLFTYIISLKEENAKLIEKIEKL